MTDHPNGGGHEQVEPGHDTDAGRRPWRVEDWDEEGWADEGDAVEGAGVEGDEAWEDEWDSEPVAGAGPAEAASTGEEAPESAAVESESAAPESGVAESGVAESGVAESGVAAGSESVAVGSGSESAAAGSESESAAGGAGWSLGEIGDLYGLRDTPAAHAHDASPSWVEPPTEAEPRSAESAGWWGRTGESRGWFTDELHPGQEAGREPGPKWWEEAPRGTGAEGAGRGGYATYEEAIAALDEPDEDEPEAEELDAEELDGSEPAEAGAPWPGEDAWGSAKDEPAEEEAWVPPSDRFGAEAGAPLEVEGDTGDIGAAGFGSGDESSKPPGHPADMFPGGIDFPVGAYQAANAEAPAAAAVTLPVGFARPKEERAPGIVVGVLAVVIVALIVAAAIAATQVGKSSSPSASTMLNGARGFVLGRSSLTYTGTQATTTPLPPGPDQLLRSRSVTGTVLFGKAQDVVVVSENYFALEYRSVGTDGLWARAARPPSKLASASWVHASSDQAFEQASVAAQAGGTAGDPTEVDRRVILQELAAGDLLPRLLQNVRSASRSGPGGRTLRLLFDPAVFGQSGPAVQSVSGAMIVDSGDRPTQLFLAASGPSGAVTASYVLRWDTPLTIPAPDPSTVVASI